MCTSLSIAELPPLTLCTVQLDSSQGQDNVLLMSNNVSQPAIIRKGILKELFLPRSAFLRGRNSVLGFCAWTEREQQSTLSGIFWPGTFLLKQRGDKEYFEGCCFMTASPLYMQQLWWCPPQWWWLVVQGT